MRAESTARRQPPPSGSGPALPPEAPLAMPRREREASRQPLRAARDVLSAADTVLSRFYVATLTIVMAVYGTLEMHRVLNVTGTVTVLQDVFLVLFSANFTWISFAFAQASLGLLRTFIPRLRRPPAVAGELPFTTAILLPVYNESPTAIAAAVLAMREELVSLEPRGFAFFILSDSTDPEAWISEEAVFRGITTGADDKCPVFYRRRGDNAERKAGNIADWVQRWGGAYEAMIVLDADSVMSATTLVTLTRRLAAAPGVGLIQTLPRVVGAKSLYARAQQFANQCYGPIYARGLSAWHGLSSNFWGHNAIIRTRAFADCCRLPILRRSPPFGGHVLSHDFIEAALLRRAGWGVRFDVDLGDSCEEAPPSLADTLIRDRRWCQGNLQHSAFLCARGLTLPTRMHILAGIMSYLSAALWLLLVATGLTIAVQAQLVRPEYFTTPSLFPNWPVFDAERAMSLFFVSMAVVLAPKVFGWLAAFASLRLLRGFGGPLLLTLSVLFETLLSVLYAPTLMLAQCGIIWSVLAGRDAGWQPQRRDDGALSWQAAWRMHRGHTVTGLGIAMLGWQLEPALFYWLLPITLGLVFSVPLAWLSGGARRGAIFNRAGLLRAPGEKEPAAIVARSRALAESLPQTDTGCALWKLAGDSELRDWHLAQLAVTRDGTGLTDFNAPRVTALWKAAHAFSLEELTTAADKAETLALLNEPGFLATRLPRLARSSNRDVGGSEIPQAPSSPW